MATTQPIKSKKDLENLKNYYLYVQPNMRNYALICIGINTALRIGDVLHLKWKDVYDHDKCEYQGHIVIHEQKTGKENCIAVNKNIMKALKMYRESLSMTLPSQYLFEGAVQGQPLSRSQAFRIIKNACEALHLPDNISCHSLRKTFGYHAWISGVSPVVLMFIYNHSSFQVTKRYLGIDQDDKDKVFLNLNL